METSSSTSLKRNQLFEGLVKAASEGKLGHALIFHSRSESSPDFTSFVGDFMKSLLCMQPTGSFSCGSCDSCRLYQSAGSDEALAHPDAFRLQPEGVKGYSVDQTRELIGSFYLKHSLSMHRVCWIKSADLLSNSGAQAANSLLKLIEEPRPNSFVLLTTENLSTVLPTIRSRCQLFRVPINEHFGTPDEDVQLLVDWLRFGGPMPEFLGPDNESFFESRDEALKNLNSLAQGVWAHVKGDLASFSRTKAYFILEFLQAIEVFALSMKFYASPGLGWSEIRVRFGKCPTS